MYNPNDKSTYNLLWRTSEAYECSYTWGYKYPEPPSAGAQEPKNSKNVIPDSSIT